jgi:FtsP/CotA-like multicopper oxidase with cupredoxin domain
VGLRSWYVGRFSCVITRRGAGRAPANVLTRRRFLMATGAVALGVPIAACASEASAPATVRIGPAGPRVDDVENARRPAGQATSQIALTAAPSTVDLGGRQVQTWCYGGQVPGPEIRVRRGDLLQVDLANDLPQPTTVHWHGLALRNDMDGVPVLTQPEVAPGARFRYEFTVPDAGTYMFHPHVGVQLDRGLYAPLIVEDPDEAGDYDSELVVVLDDWLDGSGRDADAVLADLLANGMGGMDGMDHGDMGDMGDMGGMGGMGMPRSDLLGGDSGDVIYPDYLANGRLASAPQVVRVRPGQRVRLRIINPGGDTAFRVGIPGTPMTVTHTDGFPVVPTRADAVLVGMGERVDAVVEVPDQAVPLLAVPEGKQGYAQVQFQPGAGALPDGAALVSLLDGVSVLMAADTRATEAVVLPDREPDVVHEMVLGGPGNGYRWTINDQVYDPARGIPVREGQRVRIRFSNTTTMFHPMHLHGHTFQVRTSNGPGPRKDTHIVLPGQSVDVDFDADNPGQWLTHCHNVYHGEAGMMTVVSYMQ